MRVMLGGCTCSTAASSPRVMGPSRSMVASAAWVDAVSSSPVAAACWRMRREQPGDGQAELRRQLGDLGRRSEGRASAAAPGSSRHKFSMAN